MINLNKLTFEQRNELGLKARPLIDMNTIEDLFCPECNQLLKPVRSDRVFTQKGKKFNTYQLIAYCYQCHSEWDVDHWVEVLFRRKEINGLTVIIENKTEFAIYPTTRMECKKCGKGTTHSYRSTQTRSADEPETTFYRCTICGSVTRENV